VLKRQKIPTQFLLNIILQLHVCPRSCKNLAYIGQPLPFQILPQNDPLPVDLGVGDIQQLIATEWLDIAQWSKWRGNWRNLLSLFRMVPLRTPLQSLLLPKWGSQMHISGPTSQRVPPPDEYDRRYRQVVCCAGGSRMSQAMPPFAKLI